MSKLDNLRKLAINAIKKSATDVNKIAAAVGVDAAVVSAFVENGHAPELTDEQTSKLKDHLLDASADLIKEAPAPSSEPKTAKPVKTRSKGAASSVRTKRPDWS
jgi:hypothetical protein